MAGPGTDVAIVGGCGHVGLPLAIAFADRGASVAVFDINEEAVSTVSAGRLPFLEPGASEPLARVLANGRLAASTDPAVVAGADAVVIVIGTPVDAHLNPDPHAVSRAISQVAPYLRNGQLLVLRSTVYPGVTAHVEATLRQLDLTLDVAFCPERIAEGRAMVELFELPQIVGTRTDAARERASALFRRLTDTIIELTPEEAELAKLFTNSWRYLKFAAANQFYVMANDHGLDFERIRQGLAQDYPRAADLPGAGFAAGPCLFKDTMQLASFSTTASSSATARCSSTKASRSTWCREWSSAGTCAICASGCWAWRSRPSPTTSARACPTSSSASSSSAPARCSARIRTSKTLGCSRWRRCSSRRTCWSSPRRTRTTRRSKPTSRWSTYGTCWVTGRWCDTARSPTASLDRHPRLRRRRVDHPGAQPGLRVRDAVQRGHRRRGQPGRLHGGNAGGA